MLSFSCTSFKANQFRVLLTAIANGLMQELRLQAKQTLLAGAQVTTLRKRLLKLSAHIETTVRCVVVQLSSQ